MHVCMSLRAVLSKQVVAYCREDIFFKSPKGSIDTNQKFRTFIFGKLSSTPEGLTTCDQILVITHIFARTKVVIASHFQELGGSWSVVTKTINP